MGLRMFFFFFLETGWLVGMMEFGGGFRVGGGILRGFGVSCAGG